MIMDWTLLAQLTPPPESGPIDRWIIFTMAGALVFLFGVVVKQNNDAMKKSDANGAKWEATAKTSTDELYEANRTIGRAVDTLERQGVLMETQAKDLIAVKADGVELKRILAAVEQEVRSLRDATRATPPRRQSGDD